MNRLRILTIGFLVLFTSALYTQDESTLVTVAGEEVSVEEFMYVYKKNNVQGEVMDKKSIEEYLELYINFKLKVKEAETLGLDTVSAFIDELAGYRKQLAEPYFVNEEIIEELLIEAYERKKTDIRASHILIKVGPDAVSEDTLNAYQKALDARERVMAGEDFSSVAKDVSEDPSARDRKAPRDKRLIPGNGGDLGYFSVFDMVYPFETAAYDLNKGEVSMPVRTDYGYHVVELVDKIPAQGTIEAAHLYLKMPENASSQDSIDLKAKIDSISIRLLNGEKYDDLVMKYSDDKGSASKGGLLPKFTVKRMVPEFIQVIAMMKDSSEVSAPIMTSYGWHIIKLYSKSGIEPFEDVQESMRKRLEKDKRASQSQEIIIQEIKDEYNFNMNSEALEEIYQIIDSSIYRKKWKIPDSVNLDKVMFNLEDKLYTQVHFAEYLEDNQKISKTESSLEFVNRQFKIYCDEQCRAYEDNKLEEKYPEFKAIVKEYRDGILLFELTNQKIWNYASKDTTGLKEYYELHKKEFMWDTRLDASIITVTDTSNIQTVRELIEMDMSDNVVEADIFNDSLNIVNVEREKYSRGDNELIDSIKWKKGVTDNLVEEKDKIVFIKVHQKVAPEPKSFEESRGLVTAGYQEYLEAEWIKELRNKYSVSIDDEVLSSLTK